MCDDQLQSVTEPFVKNVSLLQFSIPFLQDLDCIQRLSVADRFDCSQFIIFKVVEWSFPRTGAIPEYKDFPIFQVRLKAARFFA